MKVRERQSAGVWLDDRGVRVGVRVCSKIMGVFCRAGASVTARGREKVGVG